MEHGLKKKSNISIWLPIVKSLSFKSVLKSFQIYPISNSSFQCYEENITKSKRMVCGLNTYDTKILLQTKICVGVSTNTHQSTRSHCKDRNNKSVLKNRPLVIINEY